MITYQDSYDNANSIPLRIGVLGSTRGTTMQPIIDAIEQNALNAKIVVVISNKIDAGILDKAKKHDLISSYVSPNALHGLKKKRKDFDHDVSTILQKHNVDLVLMIGYMRIVSNEFCTLWKNRCMNIHPSLLPDFSKGMDLDVHNAVINSGKKESGCTVHFVTEDLDEGPIVCQLTCEVKPNDTPHSLKNRVQLLEGQAFIWAIKKFQNDLFLSNANNYICN
tara:strand:+ start:11220 stop:11885 length:666 start_codon:yes stop_codon:yes gene_type:complete